MFGFPGASPALARPCVLRRKSWFMFRRTEFDFTKENKMTTKGKVLVLVSSGRGLPLKDGKVYTGAGYYLNELTVPVRALMKEVYEITFANPKGNPPQVDVHSEVADFFGGDE